MVVGLFFSAQDSPWRKEFQTLTQTYTLLVFFDIHYFHHFCFWTVFRTLDEILNNAVNINLIYANRLCLCIRNFIADGYHCAVLCTFRCPGHLAHGSGAIGSLLIPLYSCIPNSIRTHGGMYMTNRHKVSFKPSSFKIFICRTKYFFHVAIGLHQFLRKVP